MPCGFKSKKYAGFRTGVLLGVTVLNAIVTLVGVKYFGYFAAAVGTALSFLIGSVVIMNIYYYKKLSFKMLKIYRQIFSRTWLCLLLSTGAIIISSRFINNGWFGFIINAGIFCIVYAVTLLLFGLKKEEKAQIPFINKLKH